MKLIKNADKSILLTPQTAMEEYFVHYLIWLVEAKEKETAKQVLSLKVQSLSEDLQS